MEGISCLNRRCNSPYDGRVEVSIFWKNKAKKWTKWPTKGLFAGIFVGIRADLWGTFALLRTFGAQFESRI
jgi:hypothetical protein